MNSIRIRNIHTCVFVACVQSACQQSIDVTDGKIMQCIMEMCREAEVLHSGSSRSSSWVHLNHWTIAWKMCRDSNYTKTWTLYHWRSPGTTMELHTAETSRTSHSFHDSSQHEACTGLKHQDFAACMDVCQSQHLGQCVVPQVATLHKNTHTHTVSKWIFHHTT